MMNQAPEAYIDGLVQEKCNSSVLAMELRLSCTNLLIYVSLGLIDSTKYLSQNSFF